MRIAIFFTPPADHPLTQAAALWLGRDAFTGEAREQPSLSPFPAAALAELTADPRRYGFHATLKAPFELAGGMSEAALLAALDDFAAETPAFVLPELVVGRLGLFFALVPAGPDAHLQRLADDCVRRFDRFRAPLSKADTDRRNPDAMNDRERRNLQDWGYPYVFDAFRFHMTLTGPVDPADQPAMRAAIDSYFAGLVPAPRRIGHLALFVEPERGAPFEVRKTARLADAEARKTA